MHESGHAIAALALNKELRWIACDVSRVVPGRRVIGLARVADFGDDIASALVLLAGDVAESLFSGRTVVGFESREALAQMRPCAFRVAREGTAALLRRSWFGVALLGRELTRRGRMTGGCARMFLDDQGAMPRQFEAEVVLQEAFLRVMTGAPSRRPTRATTQLPLTLSPARVPVSGDDCRRRRRDLASPLHSLARLDAHLA